MIIYRAYNIYKFTVEPVPFTYSKIVMMHPDRIQANFVGMKIPVMSYQVRLIIIDKSVPYRPELNRQPTSKEGSMPRQKNPRSAIIDQMLLDTPAGTEPVWEDIATKVIVEGRAPEAKRKAVVSQAKTRYKWYTEEGKKNPLDKSGEAEKEGPESKEWTKVLSKGLLL